MELLADRLLLDRIVQGLQDNQLREKYLQEKELTLDRAIELGRTTALSREQAAEMIPSEVDRIVNRKQPKKTKEKERNRCQPLRNSPTTRGVFWQD
uniref:Uncharacterized protein n=1 Tax=Rhodnius prolixus TaxID=13249 RepID=T1HJT2_RHOPR